ncbi:MAG: tRNA lysidine(34) synthetase TilS [Devosia sp.]|nr:tRNA lysidine(34) synthetase TilS [Devosia sp.]
MSGLIGGADNPATLLRLFTPVAGCGGVGLAVSGGADSLALMLLARQWAATLPRPPKITVYSVDHGLRPEAAAEVDFVCRTAAASGFAVRTLRWEGRKPTSGVQAAARAARYRLIGEAMAADGAEVLLTAHHREDQAETVLMRLAHGSGFDGLRGMTAMGEVERVRVFRPLLDVPSGRLRALVAAAGLRPVVDSSNLDRHYERVRWRQALPQLAELGLGAGQVVQLARRAGEAEDAIRQWANERFAALVQFDSLGAARLPIAPFAGLPRAVGVRLLGRLLDAVGGGQRPRALGVIERCYDRVSGAAPFAGATLLGTAVRRRADELWLSREPGRQAGAPTALGASQTLLWDHRFLIANHSDRTLSIRMAGRLSREAAERLVGRPLAAPASAIRSAPLVSGPDGEVMALGAFPFTELIGVKFAAA